MGTVEVTSQDLDFKAIAASGSKESVAESQEESASEEVDQEQSEEVTEEVASAEQISEQTEEEDQADEESEEDSEEAPQKPKKLKGYKKTIHKLREELAFLKGQASAKPETKATESQQTSAKETEPNPDDFASQSDYLKAVVKYELKQEARAEAVKKENEKKEVEQKTQFEKYQSNLSEAKKAIKDYDEVINDYIDEHGDVKFSAAMNELIFISDLAPQVIYELAKNKEELDRINSLPAAAAAKEFFKIEAKYEKKSKPDLKTITKASPPPKPISTKTVTVKKDLYDPSLSFSDFERLMNEKQKPKRR